MTVRTTRELSRPPRMSAAYARAGLTLVPGASLLPGGGDTDELPDTELVLPDTAARVEDVAAYARVCGFRLRDELPTTYPHVLAFPLHMGLMTRGDFPFGPVGLVHLENRIVAHRPIRFTERLTLRVYAAGLEPHPKGRTFTIVTEAWAGQRRVWEERSTMLRRGTGSGSGSGSGGSDDAAESGGSRGTGGDSSGGSRDHRDFPGRPDTEGVTAVAEWGVPADIGRRYAAVSGDRNPIHLHPLTARLFGFRRPIAHGMWAKARCLAYLEGRLPGSFGVRVRFRSPVVLPARVGFATDGLRADTGIGTAVDGAIDSATDHETGAAAGVAADTDTATRFQLYDVENAKPHLLGSIER